MQFDRRDRREFITLLGGSAATWPLPGRAQAAGKVRRIGYLSPAAGPNPADDACEEELRRLGWTQGQNVRIDYRYSSGRQDTVSPLVAELVGSNPDVLIAWSPPLCFAAKQATTQIPLVCLVVWDPIDIGLVSNLAHPGGNVTGVTGLGSLEIFAKRLQLLTELVPSLSRVAVLVSTELHGSSGPKDTLKAAAKSLNLELHEFEVKLSSDLDTAMRSAKNWGAQALYTFPGGFTFSFAKQIADAANVHKLPSANSHKEIALAGGLLAYAADLKELGRRGVWYLDKILRGTPPGMLPFEQLSKYELVINLKTAKTLSLNVLPTLIAVADQVIQ
jgi:putative ABC transport system substrate-binding protein